MIQRSGLARVVLTVVLVLIAFGAGILIRPKAVAKPVEPSPIPTPTVNPTPSPTPSPRRYY